MSLTMLLIGMQSTCCLFFYGQNFRFKVKSTVNTRSFCVLWKVLKCIVMNILANFPFDRVKYLMIKNFIETLLLN